MPEVPPAREIPFPRYPRKREPVLELVEAMEELEREKFARGLFLGLLIGMALGSLITIFWRAL